MTKGATMRVAYYYNQRRLPPHDAGTNPYGPLLAAALERHCAEVKFELAFDEAFLRANRDRLDVIHLNWPHFSYYHDDPKIMKKQLAAFVGQLGLARDLGYKLVWTAHNLYPHNRRHIALDHEGRLALCRLSTAIIAHCQVAADAVRETFGRADRVFVIPHGHFVDVYPQTIGHDDARAELGVPDGAFAYGFFGSLQPYKGIEPLFDAFARLDRDDAWLLISGGGKDPAYLDGLRRRAAELPRVVLRTYRRAPSEDIALIMRAADVVTLPFVATMTSGTLMLALSWGRPVIAPALGCLPATVTPDAGILYDPEEPDALFRALTRIRERDLVNSGRAALACALQYDWDEIALRTLEAYRA
jgi:glycosyltransferase involved in cell wall biosynthesis